MLSQRISKTALTMLIDQEPEERLRRRGELAGAVEQWRKAHNLLKQSDVASGHSRQLSHELARRFDSIEPDYQSMLEGAEGLLRASENPEAHPAELRKFVDALLAHEAAFLEGMDQAVLQYEKEAQLRVLGLQRMEFFLCALLMLVLALEGWFVFRPAVKSLAETLRRLEHVGVELRNEITMHQRTEEVLRESEEKFKELAEKSPVGICLLQNGKFRYVNPKFAQCFGYSVDELIGHKGAEDLVFPDDRAEVDGFDPSDFSPTMPRSFRGLARDQTVRFIEAYASRTTYQSRPAIIGTWLDVTEHKRAEEQIEIASRTELGLRDADQRKNEFLAMLAHELRNPLASVLGAADVLMNSEDLPNRRWATDVIGRQSGQLGRLVDDLLDVARITRGKIRLRRELTDAAEIMERACEAVGPLCADREHELVRDFPFGELWLEVDPTRLEQVVVNLLTNSVKYTRPGGRIELRAWKQEGEVIIGVADNGIGIRSGKLPEIFELFTQGERSAARNEGGLGIGLTVVRRLVEMHGGYVNAESAGMDQGSTFTIRLPATSPPPKQEGKTPTQSAAEPGLLRILVVDDNADMAQGLLRILKRAGHQMSVAYDGYTALETARTFAPDVVLLDIGLPGIDGYEVAVRLRKEPCCLHCLIIALSGYGQEEDRRRSREAGFDYHLLKPIDLRELKQLLHENAPNGAGGPAREQHDPSLPR